MSQRLLETFLELVRIDSPTGREALLAARVSEMLAEAGCDVRFDGSAEVTGSDTGNLIAVLPQTAPGMTVALSAHLDVVEPCEGVEPVVSHGVVRASGTTVLGADDKAGIAAIVEAVRRLSESPDPHGAVRIVLTTGEEVGLRGAKALDAAECAADLCLVLDADGAVGGIVVGAPTHYTFRATFRGRSAHAGVEPERGVSAIAMACRAVSAMELGRLDDRTTANIGTIAGGTATNVVAPAAELTGECRSLDPVRVEQVRDAMNAALRDAATSAGGESSVEWTREYTGFSVADGHPALAIVEGACADIGVESRRFTTGGGSDGNIFAAHGVTTLVLSSGMRSVHSTSEELAVRELELLADLVVRVLRRAVT